MEHTNIAVVPIFCHQHVDGERFQTPFEASCSGWRTLEPSSVRPAPWSNLLMLALQVMPTGHCYYCHLLPMIPDLSIIMILPYQIFHNIQIYSHIYIYMCVCAHNLSYHQHAWSTRGYVSKCKTQGTTDVGNFKDGKLVNRLIFRASILFWPPMFPPWSGSSHLCC